MSESKRLLALDSYQIKDSLSLKELDDITELASIICGTPVSLITLLDSERQWFKSKVGLEITGTEREHAFCHYAIQSPYELTIIEDSLKDERLRDNPLVSGKLNMRFYAGAPLVTPDGFALGSLCVIDHKPRTLTDEQKRALTLLSNKVMELLELRKASLAAEKLSRSSDQKFLTLTEQSPDFIAVLNHSLEFTYANRGQGLNSREQLLGKSVIETLEPEYITEFSHLCSKVLQGSKHEKMTLILRNEGNDVAWVSCRLSPLLDVNGKVSSILLTGTNITERLLAEEKEREIKAYYESLFYNNPSAVARLSLDGIIEEINDSSVNVFGYSREEVIGLNFQRFIDPTFHNEAAEAFKKALAGELDSFEIKALSKDGTSLDLMATVAPVLVDGRVIKLQVVTKDISETKRSQKLAEELAAAQSSIFESINEGFLVLDKNGRIIFLNDVCVTLLTKGKGLSIKSKDEFLYKSLFEVFPNLKYTSLYHKCSEVKNTGKPVHYRETFPLSQMTLNIDIYPTKNGLAVHFLDVTEVTAIREDFEKLYFVASNVTNGVLILNTDTTIEWANNSFLDLIGSTLDEAKGLNLSQLLGEENINMDTITRIGNRLNDGRPFSEEISYISSVNKKYWLRADITPGLDEHGNIKQYFIILSDYTGLNNAKEELKQQANYLFLQNKDLQEFNYIVSHNLRAPVAKIMGLTDLLTEVDKNTDVFDDSLEYLTASVNQLDTVVRDINMILSVRDKKDVVTKEEVNLAEVWGQVFHEMQELITECKGHVIVDIQEGLCVKGVKAYLYSVFHNLLSNAIKYRSDERSLEIKVKCFGSQQRGAIISFSDNGSGFDRKQAGSDAFKLYKRFHTHKEGRGIGLYLVKTHVETLEGQIEVDSKVDEGTRFLIYLP